MLDKCIISIFVCACEYTLSGLAVPSSSGVEEVIAERSNIYLKLHKHANVKIECSIHKGTEVIEVYITYLELLQ